MVLTIKSNHWITAHLRSKRYKDRLFSFDLKSATDSFPVQISHRVLKALLGLRYSVNIIGILVNFCKYDISSLLNKPFGPREKYITFGTGQPLGLYSSWPLFTLTHHLLVWLAAEIIHPGRRFDQYALLGDDIVIADPKVAILYKHYMNDLGVSISVPKSLVSQNGCCEFAKRFRVDFLKKDLSPVPVKALLTVRSTIGMAQLVQRLNLPVRQPTDTTELAGAGFRVRSRLASTKSLGKKWDRLRAVSLKPTDRSELAFEFWLGRGKPLNPYLKGILIQWLRSQTKLKQLRLADTDTVSENWTWFVEYTLYNRWVSSWLQLLLWHTKIQFEPNPKFLDFFAGPVVETSCTRREVDLERIRYGLAFKLYDMAGQEHILPLALHTGREDYNPLWIDNIHLC